MITAMSSMNFSLFHSYNYKLILANEHLQFIGMRIQ
ncbi:MAG: hypothetical protein K0Q56_2600 [Sporolactobacillus laevolacticus]|jgi:hypothetical protein|nr:hypothetical protein [Sporolactobacillus laevolacticus]